MNIVEYTPEQNSVAERKNHSIMNRVRCMLLNHTWQIYVCETKLAKLAKIY